MTDPHRPDAEQRRMRSLLDDAPGAEPPAWLDANIRAAAAQAAEVARQRSLAAGAPEGGDAPKPRRFGWLPIGATMAVAVLGLLLVISTPVDRGSGPPAQEAAQTRDDAVRQNAPAAATDPARRQRAAETESRADRASSERDEAALKEAPARTPAEMQEKVASEAPPPSSAKRESPQTLGAAAPSPAAPKALDHAADGAVPDTAVACVARIDELKRSARRDDARRLLKACRDRFPQHSFPAEMIREFAN